MEEPTAAGPPGQDELARDLEAFAPKPLTYRFVDDEGKKHTLVLVEFADLSYRRALELLRIERDQAAMTDAVAIREADRSKVALLAPSATAEDLDAMSSRHVREAIRFALGLPVRPPEASGASLSGPSINGSGSASTSPAPLASTAGATTS